jgi:hypothetical protein
VRHGASGLLIGYLHRTLYNYAYDFTNRRAKGSINMSFLNETEREKLLNELKSMAFNPAKRKLRHMDSKARLVLLRNVQQTGEWMTRYDLPTLGTRVTLIEDRDASETVISNAKYDMVKVIVEPLSGNRT